MLYMEEFILLSRIPLQFILVSCFSIIFQRIVNIFIKLNGLPSLINGGNYPNMEVIYIFQIVNSSN